jgi:DNA mismatch repair protein MutS2
MPEDIMKRARASLSTQEIELTTLIAGLHKRIEETDGLRASLENERAALAVREQKIIQDAERRETAKLRELETRFEEMQRRWQERGDQVVARIAEAAERRKAVDEAHRQTARAGREMREDWENFVPQAAESVTRKLKIEEGSRVRLKGIREPARVRRVLNDGRFEVEAGFMKMRVAPADIEDVLPDAPEASKLPKNVTYRSGPALSPSVQEINVIGEREQEAVEHVERFLDAAVMATAARVRIVHGHGMGILKRAIQDLLKQSPHVETFYPASQSEGGAGATIAELKE